MSAQDSLHDFFDEVPLTVEDENRITYKHSVDNRTDSLNPNTSPKHGRRTLSRDTLVEGYVVVEVLDHDSKDVVISGETTNIDEANSDSDDLNQNDEPTKPINETLIDTNIGCGEQRCQRSNYQSRSVTSEERLSSSHGRDKDENNDRIVTNGDDDKDALSHAATYDVVDGDTDNINNDEDDEKNNTDDDFSDNDKHDDISEDGGSSSNEDGETSEYDPGSVMEMPNFPSNNTDNDVTTVIEERIEVPVPFNSSKEIIKEIAMKMNKQMSASLSNRITEFLNLRLPLSNEKLSNRAREKVNLGVPYPLQCPVGAIRVPSGVLGDSVKPERPTSDGVLGDVYTPVTADDISPLNQNSAELGCTSAITGKISETPRLSSMLREIGMRPTSGVATGVSDSSGRKNPQAKVDSEVRNLERVTHVNIFRAGIGSMNPVRRSLPPISSDNTFIKVTGGHHGTQGETTAEKTNLLKKQSCNKAKNPVAKEKRKPSVPRVLRSSVCYHEGKVDVSIYSDPVIMNQSDPVHLNINFVRQPLGPIAAVKSAAPRTGKQPKTEPITRKAMSGGIKTGTTTKQQPRRQQIPEQNPDNKPSKYLAPIQNTPKVNTGNPSGFKSRRNKHQKVTRRRKGSHSQKTVQQQSQANFWSRNVDPLDWNIVDRRAQKPPFNTHTDPDASYRHMQFFMDY